jgi:hypothetical protein
VNERKFRLDHVPVVGGSDWKIEFRGRDMHLFRSGCEVPVPRSPFSTIAEDLDMRCVEISQAYLEPRNFYL